MDTSPGALKDDGHIDLDGWGTAAQLCTVWHFWGGEVDERGQLVRTPGGQWAFSYVPGEEDDEPIFRFDTHVFAVGEYVTITEHDGEDRVFRVVSVQGVRGPASE